MSEPLTETTNETVAGKRGRNQPENKPKKIKKRAYAEEFKNLARRVDTARRLLAEAIAAADPGTAKALLAVAIKELGEYS